MLYWWAGEVFCIIYSAVRKHSLVEDHFKKVSFKYTPLSPRNFSFVGYMEISIWKITLIRVIIFPISTSLALYQVCQASDRFKGWGFPSVSWMQFQFLCISLLKNKILRTSHLRGESYIEGNLHNEGYEDDIRISFIKWLCPYLVTGV